MLRTLHDNWTLRPVGGPVAPDVADAGPVPASVPGAVHTDLLAAGLIPDPYLDDHERRLAWIGLVDWRYETTFEWTRDEHERVALQFDGLDTVARVELNGEFLAHTANMHRGYRFDVTDRVHVGPNTLSVTFASAIRHADRMSLELGARPHVNHHPYNAIRKMAASFGWDWGPDLATAGIWRPVSIHSWSTVRLASVRPVTTLDGARGRVDVHIGLERARPAGAGELLATVTVGDVTASVPVPPVGTDTTVTVLVEDVARWWPKGHGEPNLYDITVGIHPRGGPELDAWRGRIGFRSVRLDITPDEHGTAVSFVVNDRPVFVKGANWIPDDVFPHRVTRERYAARLTQAQEAGINLIRVWGGGIYEADAFYDECDERGLMIWQDFLFACAAYSEEEPIRTEVIAEARENVTRLMPHPSLVLWNGNNENLWGYHDWEWRGRLDGQTWGGGYYHEILPAIVHELDPGRPYAPGSPWSPSGSSQNPAPPNDPAHATMHIWDVWNELDYTRYRGYRPRFVAEFGWQGPPTWSTLRRALSDDPLTPESPGMITHQKAADGNVKLTGGLIPHLALPDTMDAWHWAMSLNQARAVQTGVEYFRSLGPLCTGSVVWQLNDCWPAVSWSAVDGDGRRKPMLYALRHAHASRLVTVQPDGDGLRVVVVNETPEAWRGSLEVSRRAYDGTVLAKAEFAVEAALWGSAQVRLPDHLGAADDPAQELLVAQLGDRRGLWTFVEDRDSALAPPEFTARSVAVKDGYRVTVTATTLLRDLALLVDKLDPDAVVDDMLVTLLPGETVSWHVRSSAVLEPGLLLGPRVLRSANELVRPGPDRRPVAAPRKS